MRTIFCLLVLLAAPLLTALSSTKANTSDALQLAYVTSDPDDICISDIEGNVSQCLTAMAGEKKRDPLWSPDGRFLIYRTYTREGITTNYLADLQLETAIELKFPLSIANINAWTSDGSRLLLTGSPIDNENSSQIYRMNIENGSLEQITYDTNSCYAPSPSPDGKQIAYICGYPNKTLNIMNANGSQPHTIASNRDFDNLTWSPNGIQFAFLETDQENNYDNPTDIYVMNIDGSSLKRLTDTDIVKMGLQWSPDGKQFVFFGHEVGAFDHETKQSLLTEIYRINADGSDPVDLTNSPGLDFQPSWSPDGQWIAFGSSRWIDDHTQQGGIFIMRPDGSDLRMVTHLPPFGDAGMPEASNPVWRPIPHP